MAKSLLRLSLLILCGSLFILFPSSAQKTESSLEVWTGQQQIACPMGTLVEAQVSIRNTSDQPVELRVTRSSKRLSRNQESFFRLNGRVTASRETVSQNTLLLEPNETSEAFIAFFSTGFKKGEIEVTYTFSNVADKDDATELVLTYQVSDEVPSNKLYVSEHISISFMYPNPAVHYGEFDYRMPTATKSKARIDIHDVLGKKLGTYQLAGSKYSLRVPLRELESGVYFYALVIDDKTVATKKFVVKK